jgi:soluble lytic murein transglycosylase-like protein
VNPVGTLVGAVLASAPFIQYHEVPCVMYTWREIDSRLIVVSADGGPEFVPTLSGARAKEMDHVETLWQPLAVEVSAQVDVPFQVTLAMIFQESRGNERAFRREPNGMTGIGLMQITHPSLKHGYSDDTLFDPKINVSIGVNYVASLIKRYGRDWPKIFAAFNAGSVRTSIKNQWGMVCTGNHVDAEVAAYNYQIQQYLEIADRAAALQFDLRDILDDQLIR